MDNRVVAQIACVDSRTSPAPRSGHAMTYLPALDLVVLVGGLGSDDEYFGDVWVWRQGEWSMRSFAGAVLPCAFGSAIVPMDDGKSVWLIGGLTQTQMVKRIYSLNFVTNVCESFDMPRLPAMWGSSAVLMHDSDDQRVLVVFGGMLSDDEATNARYTINIERRSVKSFRKTNCPARRRHNAVVWNKHFMFVVGGRDAIVFYDDLWLYNGACDVWSRITSGTSASKLRSVWTDPRNAAATMALHSQNPMDIRSSFSPRTGLSAVVVGDRLLLFGGFFVCEDGAWSFNDVHVYNLLDHQWHRAIISGEAPTPCTMAGLVVLNNNDLLLFGGRRDTDYPHAHTYTLRLVNSGATLRGCCLQFLRRAAVSKRLREVVPTRLAASIATKDPYVLDDIPVSVPQ